MKCYFGCRLPWAYRSSFSFPFCPKVPLSVSLSLSLSLSRSLSPLQIVSLCLALSSPSEPFSVFFSSSRSRLSRHRTMKPRYTKVSAFVCQKCEYSLFKGLLLRSCVAFLNMFLLLPFFPPPSLWLYHLESAGGGRSSGVVVSVRKARTAASNDKRSLLGRWVPFKRGVMLQPAQQKSSAVDGLIRKAWCWHTAAAWEALFTTVVLTPTTTECTHTHTHARTHAQTHTHTHSLSPTECRMGNLLATHTDRQICFFSPFWLDLFIYFDLISLCLPDNTLNGRPARLK